MMRFFVGIDLERGIGTIRWERITQRNISRLLIGLGSIIATAVTLATWLAQR